MGLENQELNDSLKFLARASVLVFVAIVFSKILGYAYRIIVARYYGPEAYGLLILAFTIFGWFLLFSQVGLGSGILRYLSFYIGKKNDQKVSFITKFFLGLLLATGVFTGVILFLFSDIIAEQIFSNSQLSIFLKFFSFMLPLAGLRTVLSLLMQAHEKIMGLTFVSKISDNLVRLIVIIFLIIFGIGQISIPITYVVASSITLIISYSICRVSFKKIFRIKPKKDKKLVKKIFSYSLPLIFFGFSMSLIAQADSFMIGIFKTVADVGFYNAAAPLAFLLIISVELFGQMFFPLVTKEYARGNLGLVKQLSQQVGKWVYLISLPLFVLFIIFPGAFIKLFFGEEYLVAINVLRYLSIGAMFTSIFAISKMLVLMKGKSDIIFKYTLIILVLNIILNLLLIPRYGIDGAAIATMISYICLGLLFGFQSWKHLRIVPIRRKMLKISIVALIPTALIFLVRELAGINIATLLIFGILFFGVYVALLFLTGCLDENDVLIVKMIKKRFFKK